MEFKNWGRWVRSLLVIGVPSALLLVASGCATPAYQREHLADPIMTFEQQAKKDARMTKSMEAREGSTGGNGGAGGGCACN